jgi:bis(5'-nucleosidyl)-tetraphosphatase
MTHKIAKYMSSGIIPVKKINGTWQFLLLRCFKYWDFPKGHVEENENPLEAAIRELTEETGLSQIKFSWGKDFADTEVYSQGKVARYFLAEVTSNDPVSIVANPLTGIVEHHEHRWLEYEEARKLLVPRVQNILDWAQQKLR